MGKLIDADELKAVYIPSEIEGFEKMMVPVEVVLQNIDDMPTVDAVPVVRCRDCKNSPLKTWFGCPMAHLPFNGDRWCWKGEREDGEQE